MKQVWRTIEQYEMLQSGDNVLLGVSGGPDSMALLHLLYSSQERLGIHLFVVHVHHGLRPEAEEEASYVQEQCAIWGIPFRLFRIDVAAWAQENGMSLEQAGHEARFACFREMAEAWQIDKLALGHHKDDRAESSLLHLIRGCGLDGLAAMPPKDGWIIRPLAQVSKGELLHYCEAHHLHYFTDSSNLEPECLRNQIRLELLPQLREYNPRIVDALLRLQECCSADTDYLEQSTEQIWRQYGSCAGGCVQFPATVWQGQHTAIQRRLLQQLYRQLTGSGENLTFRQIEQMEHIARGIEGSQQLSLFGGAVFYRRYDVLGVEWQQQRQESYQYFWQWQQPLRLEEAPYEFIGMVAEERGASRDEHWTVSVDAAQLGETLEIRNRKAGDCLQLSCGHKSLKKFMIDKKIPAEERNRLPLVLCRGKIIWIPGYFLADCVKITAETQKRAVLRCVKQHTRR